MEGPGGGNRGRGEGHPHREGYLAVLHRAALSLTEPVPLAEVLQRILKQACALADLPQGVMALYDPDRDLLVVEAVTEALRPWVTLEVRPGTGLLGQAWQRGEVLVVPDYDAWPGRLPGFPAGVTGSAAAFPLRYAGRVVGVLAVGHPDAGRRLHPGQVRLLEYFADLAAVAVESARQRDVAQRRGRELELLHRLHLALDRQGTEGALLETTVASLHQVFGYERVGVFLLEDGELVLRAHTAPPHERPVVRIPLGAGVNGRAACTRAPQLVTDVSQDPDFLGSVAGVQSLLAVPLQDGHTLLGTLSVATLKPRTLSREDARFLEEVGHVVSHALVEVRLREALRRSERWFRALVERSAEAVAVVDLQGRVRYAAPSVRSVLGYPPEEVVGKDVAAFLHPADLEWLRTGPGRALREGGRELEAVVRARHRDGRWRWVEVVARNLAADPDVGGIVANFRDVTDRWEAEQTARIRARQHAALAAMGRLALEADLDTLLQSATDRTRRGSRVLPCSASTASGAG